MKATVTKTFKFCAAHRLLDYKGPCANIHGHNYKVEVEARRTIRPVNDMGMVVDFKELDAIQDWLDANWDHKLLLKGDDFEMQNKLGIDNWTWLFEGNPTAENMAGLLYDTMGVLLPAGIEIERVRVWETDKCYAEVKRD